MSTIDSVWAIHGLEAFVHASGDGMSQREPNEAEVETAP
jgi:hypothetical protein